MYTFFLKHRVKPVDDDTSPPIIPSHNKKPHLSFLASLPKSVFQKKKKKN